MTGTPDFSGEVKVVDASAVANAAAALQMLVSDIDAKRAAIEATTALLQLQEQDLRRLTDNLVPDAMEQFGIEELKLADGRKLKRKTVTNANITVEDRAEAFEWLMKNGHGSIIKRVVSAAVTGEQDDKLVQAAIEALAAKHLSPEVSEKIHPQTLNALAAEMLEKGLALPPTIHVHQFNRADVTQPRTKRGNA
jgi:hypothetical protein